MQNSAINEMRDYEEDLSVTDQLQLVDQLLALSRQCWSRSFKSYDGDLAEMRRNLVEIRRNLLEECETLKVLSGQPSGAA